MPRPHNLAWREVRSGDDQPTLVTSPSLHEPDEGEEQHQRSERTDHCSEDRANNGTSVVGVDQWNDDNSTLIADVDMMEDEGDEGDGESIVGLVAGVEVRKDGEVEYMRILYSVIQEFLTELDERTNCERSAGHRSPVSAVSLRYRCFHYRDRKVEQSIFDIRTLTRNVLQFPVKASSEAKTRCARRSQ